MVKIAVPKETDPNEGRVAATPDTVKRYIALGATVVVESGAGEGSRVPDAEYVAEGAQIAADAKAAVRRTVQQSNRGRVHGAERADLDALGHGRFDVGRRGRHRRRVAGAGRGGWHPALDVGRRQGLHLGRRRLRAPIGAWLRQQTHRRPHAIGGTRLPESGRRQADGRGDGDRRKDGERPPSTWGTGCYQWFVPRRLSAPGYPMWPAGRHRRRSPAPREPSGCATVFSFDCEFRHEDPAVGGRKRRGHERRIGPQECARLRLWHIQGSLPVGDSRRNGPAMSVGY